MIHFSHKTNFYEELEEQLKTYNIEESLSNLSSLTNQQIEQIDNAVTIILNQARKKVKGMKRNILYSYEKAKRWGMIQF